MGRRADEAPLVARVPADVEKPDKIAFGLTARHLGIAATVALGLWALYTGTRGVVPLAVFAVVALPIAAVTAALVLGRRDGLGLDRVAVAALRHARAPHRLVPTLDSEPIPDVPGWIGAKAAPLPAPLRLPAEAVASSGVIDLGRDGFAVVCVCSTVNFSLRTAAEQNTLVAVFARWLNSLSAPVQILIRADRVDVGPMVAEIEQQAPGLPHPALEVAAREHARFLADLARSRDLLCRTALLVLHEPGTGNRAAAERTLLRRAEEAARSLAAAEITVTPLAGDTAISLLRSACNPMGVRL